MNPVSEFSVTQSSVPLQVTDDCKFVSAILGGDRKATAEFVSRFADRIYGYVWSRLLPRHDAVDDLVQDVLLSAWRSLAQFSGEGNLEAWLFGIARHRIAQHYRTRLRECMQQLAEEDCASALDETGPHPDDILDEQRVRERTQRVLAALPEAYSIALQYRYWEKCSTREIALNAGKTEKSVERLLARAREAFRKGWENEQ